MNKLFLSFCLIVISSVFTFAQSGYNKGEFYVGYSNNQVDTKANNNSGNSVQNFFDNRLSFNGFEVSGVGNISRYVGLKADFSGAYRNKNFNSSYTNGGTTTNIGFETRNSLYNILGGVQIKDNTSEKTVKPFAHVLVGAGHVRYKVSNATCTNSAVTNCSSLVSSSSDTGLAGAFGGGLDIKLSDRVDLRAIQVDYNPIRLNGQTNNNVRFGVGLTFK